MWHCVALSPWWWSWARATQRIPFIITNFCLLNTFSVARWIIITKHGALQRALIPLLAYFEARRGITSGIYHGPFQDSLSIPHPWIKPRWPRKTNSLGGGYACASPRTTMSNLTLFQSPSVFTPISTSSGFYPKFLFGSLPWNFFFNNTLIVSIFLPSERKTYFFIPQHTHTPVIYRLRHTNPLTQLRPF